MLHLLRLALHLECALTPPPHAGVGVGGGNKPGCETSALAPSCGAQFCLFKAKDNTLSNFTDAGSMYTTNETFGLVDSNIVWQPTNTSANMMECPDFFPLGSGGKHVLIGSLYKTNQWWIGTVAGNPPRFTPESVGIVDYGNGYAAKTGSTWKQTGASRRLVFVSPATVCRPICPRGCLTQTLSATGFHRLAGAHRADRLRSLPHHAPRSVHQHAPQRPHAEC